MTTFERDLDAVLADVKAMLLAKNQAYGDSALNPVRVFSQADPIEQLRVRIDDKLSRLTRGQPQDNEDTVGDLLGYLVLLKVAQKGRQDAPEYPEGNETMGGPYGPLDALLEMDPRPDGLTLGEICGVTGLDYRAVLKAADALDWRRDVRTGFLQDLSFAFVDVLQWVRHLSKLDRSRPTGGQQNGR